MTLRRYATLDEHLWARVDKSEECWEFVGAVQSAGYGQIKHRGQLFFAHRLSWELANGPIPAGLFVCHHCDNRRCVRPSHLFLGTNQDNQLDARAKDRLAIGERNAHALLTAAQVLEIKSRLAKGEGPTAISKDYGVSRPTVQAIKQGRNWRAE